MLREWQDLLRKIGADKKALRMFSMGVWASTRKPVIDKPVCATAACAGGWATTIPSFSARGLKLRTARFYPKFVDICCGENIGYEAITDAVGINAEQARSITYTSRYFAHTITPLMVVARIQRVIEEIEGSQRGAT